MKLKLMPDILVFDRKLKFFFKKGININVKIVKNPILDEISLSDAKEKELVKK